MVIFVRVFGDEINLVISRLMVVGPLTVVFHSDYDTEFNGFKLEYFIAGMISSYSLEFVEKDIFEKRSKYTGIQDILFT